VKAVAIFPERKEIRLIEHEAPQITQPTQVKLRMLEVGVCGTDRDICTFAFGTLPAGSEYLIIGHESLGEVVEVGSSVSTLKPGDLAVTVVRRPCQHADCRACQVGRQDFCYTGDYTERGIKEAHGFMTEFVVDDERYMYFVPRELRDVGILVEPLTIAEKALAEVWRIQQRLPWLLPDAPDNEPGRGLKALVLGAGPIGLLGAMALVTAGFETYVYSRSQAPNAKAAIVEAIGATYLSSSTIAPQQLGAHTGQIDLVYEALNAEPIAFEVMNVLGPNGIFVFTSNPNQPGINAASGMRRLMGKNQLIFGTVNAGPDAFTFAIRDLGIFMQRWPNALRSLITGRYSLEQAHDVLLGKMGGIKNIIILQPE
jgi:glucose 1-dehydrogenase